MYIFCNFQTLWILYSFFLFKTLMSHSVKPTKNGFLHANHSILWKIIVMRHFVSQNKEILKHKAMHHLFRQNNRTQEMHKSKHWQFSTSNNTRRAIISSTLALVPRHGHLGHFTWMTGSLHYYTSLSHLEKFYILDEMVTGKKWTWLMMSRVQRQRGATTANNPAAAAGTQRKKALSCAPNFHTRLYWSGLTLCKKLVK